MKVSKKLTMIICMAIICGFFMLSSANAKVIYVNKNVIGGSNDGTSWANAYNDLQDAIDAATSGDEIWVKKATYYPKAVTGDQRNRTFTLKSGVSIYGGFLGTETYRHERDWKANETILSGYIDASTRCFHVVYAASATADGDYYLDGFKITSGKAEYDTDAANTDNYGGAIYYGASRYKIVNCNFYNNSAFRGGAIGIQYSPSAVIRNCSFTYNTSPDQSGASGGAIFAFTSNLTIDRCLFESNSAGKSGGAIYLSDSPATVTNSTFFKNQADSYGGALYLEAANQDKNATITNCTIIQNTGLQYGGGIMTNNLGNIDIKNSIVWHNHKASNLEEDIFVYNTTNTSSHNVIKAPSTFSTDATDVTGAASENLQIDTDTKPNNATWAPETIALLNGDTVAINTGTTDSPVTDIDQRLAGRDTQPDRGAFEYSPKPAVLTLPSSEQWCEEADIAGQVLSEGDTGASVTARGLDWGIDPGALTNHETYSGGAAITDPFVITIRGLDTATTYFYQAWATNATGTSKGEILSFTTKLCGDVNGDGNVRIDDAITALQIIAKVNPGFAPNMDADVNRDGKISYEEALYILRKVAGL